MNSRQRQQRSALVLVFVVGAAFILLILALALGGGGSQPQNKDRSAPAPVQSRVAAALGANDKPALYEELSPSMKQMLPSSQFAASQPASSANTVIDVLEAPQVKTEPPWSSEWADGKIRATHDGIVEEYVVRYHLENGEWWLYATLKVK